VEEGKKEREDHFVRRGKRREDPFASDRKNASKRKGGEPSLTKRKRRPSLSSVPGRSSGKKEGSAKEKKKEISCS